MRNIKIIVVICIFALMSNSIQIYAQQFSQDPLYQLKFQDDFDSLGLNTNKWFTSWQWTGHNGANSNIDTALCNHNWEVYYNRRYPNDTANRKYDTTGTGFQRLVSKREDFYANATVFHSPCPPEPTSCISYGVGGGCWNNACPYDSSMLFKFSTAVLRSHYSFTYGYYEMRYRLSNHSASPYNAVSPTFWMYGSSYNVADSANYSELDFFEMDSRDWKMAPNIHYRKTATSPFWHATSWGSPAPYIPYTPHMFPDVGSGYNGGTWHTVGCEWTPNYTDFYYDSNDTIRRYSDDQLPIHNLCKMQIILTSGMPADNYCLAFHQDTTPSSFNYDIDYVKVYQINQVANCPNTSGTFLSFATNSFVSKLYRDLTVGGSGTAILNSGSYHLAGQDFVLLQDGFEASGSATVIISTTKCQPRQSFELSPRNDSPQLDINLIKNMNEAKKHNNE